MELHNDFVVKGINIHSLMASLNSFHTADVFNAEGILGTPTNYGCLACLEDQLFPIK